MDYCLTCGDNGFAAIDCPECGKEAGMRAKFTPLEDRSEECVLPKDAYIRLLALEASVKMLQTTHTSISVHFTAGAVLDLADMFVLYIQDGRK